MKKLELKLDNLAVESFITDHAGEVRGTVAGQNEPAPTVSCGGTCDNSCANTCDYNVYTCANTCAASCWGSCQTCNTCQYCTGHGSCPPTEID